MTGKIGWYDGAEKEYIIDQPTPRPWSNVIANKDFGTLITNSGASGTWFLNSSLFRLTPWVNDPVTQECGEKLAIIEANSGETWTPLSGRVRHGLGYSVFEAESRQIAAKTRVFVHKTKSLKYVSVKLQNLSKITQKLTVTYTCQFVLGTTPAATKRFLWTKELADKTTLIAKVAAGDFRNEYSAFLTPSRQTITLPAGKEVAITFVLGVAKDKELTKTLAWVKKSSPDDVFTEVTNFWKNLGRTVEIACPDEDLNHLFNDRLLYQVLVCRLWARTCFFQPSVAFGFRDQLQDSLSLLWSHPEMTREQILLSASRMTPDGFVQKWWLQPENKGTISASSDTHLWLIFAAAKYAKVTGDLEIFSQEVPFLSETEKLSGTLFDHCLVGLERTLTSLGSHGLPLMLSGDWNDSLSNIGPKKIGESVWLAMFLSRLLNDFSQICEAKKYKRAQDYARLSREFADLAVKHGWADDRFARAFSDEGARIGTSDSDLLKIDSIVQSWSVICGQIEAGYGANTMETLERELIDHKNKLVRLLAPPIIKNEPYLGYISQYPPGVRENGGFYCHAAAWVVQAFARLGEGDRAMEIVDMVNPFKRDPKIYKGEPYALASDIYTEEPYVGMAGWTWYTGSAATLYIILLEEIFGIKVAGDSLTIDPCLP